ncbi:hypothetical protein WDW86_14405 [Bdellovibrionota bacterium FG-2]
MKNLFVIRVLGLAIGLTIALASLGGCQRSTAFRKDQDVNSRPETPSYYGGKKTPSQRAESIGQPKKRVLVLNFWNDTPVKSGDYGSYAADELRRALFGTQRMILPTDVKSDLNTSDLIQGDKVRVSQLIREGRRLGVGVMVIGRISKIVFRQKGDDVGVFRQKQSFGAVDIEIKLFDITAGREIIATSKSGEASTSAMAFGDQTNLDSPEYRAELIRLSVRNAVGPLVGDIVRAVEKMAWEGRIAKVTGNKLYINAGRASGLVGGDILKVMTLGDDVYDPTSGAFLGRSQGQLKGTLEVVDFIGPDGAVCEIHTGGNFKEGDPVQLY